MTRKLLHILLLPAFLLFTGNGLQAQLSSADTGYIRQFSRQNVVEAYPGQYGTLYNFTSAANRRNNYRLVANTSSYFGIYLNYKWMSLKYSWAIPGTQLDRNTKFHYTSLAFNFSAGHMLLHPFYHSYNGLLIPEQRLRRHRTTYQPLRDIHASDAGTDLYYFTNAKKFSFHAAMYFSERQVKSAGSLLLMATPMWQRLAQQYPQPLLRAGNPVSVTLPYNKQWASLTGQVGYAYNLVFKKGLWSIAPGVAAGGGALKEFHTGNQSLRSVYNLQGWINAGYNGSRYYCYLNGQWGNLRTNLQVSNMHQTNTDISLTGGWRFGNLSRKLLGIL